MEFQAPDQLSDQILCFYIMMPVQKRKGLYRMAPRTIWQWPVWTWFCSLLHHKRCNRASRRHNGSWSAANYDANMNSLSYEVCQQLSASDAEFIENENMVCIAEIWLIMVISPNYSNIEFHNEFQAPHACRSLELHGGYNDSLRDYVIAKIKHYQSLGSTVKKVTQRRQ